MGDGKRVKNRGEGLFALAYGAVFLGLLKRNPQVEASLCLACICALNQEWFRGWCHTQTRGYAEEVFPWGCQPLPHCHQSRETDSTGLLDCDSGDWCLAMGCADFIFDPEQTMPGLQASVSLSADGLAGLCEFLGPIELQ